jgi:hypothetical protein
MSRLKSPEIVVMVLALLGGLGFLVFVGNRLILTALGRTNAETGGGAFAVSGGVTRTFAVIVVVVFALLVATAVALWRRRKPGRDKRSA